MRRASPSFPALVLSFAALAGPLLASGCGYRLVGGTDELPGVRTVAIETPRNDSYEPGVEFVVADALRREFLRRGGVRLTNDPSRADLVLTGSVPDIETRGQSFSSVVLALEYEVTLTLDLEAQRPDGEALPISRSALRESELYLASADVEATRKNREEALRRLARLLAGRVHDSLSESLSR